MASTIAGAPALKYRYVNKEISSLGQRVNLYWKGLNQKFKFFVLKKDTFRKMYKNKRWWRFEIINFLASPSAGAPALKYGDVNTETTSPGEVKGLTMKKTNRDYLVCWKKDLKEEL